MNVLNQSTAAGGTALAILVVGGIVGNLIGGRVADRFGYRAAGLAEFALLACVLPLFLLSGSPLWAFLLLIPIGLLLSAPNSAMVVLGQTYLPNHIGFSSGVTMGLAFSFGGIVSSIGTKWKIGHRDTAFAKNGQIGQNAVNKQTKIEAKVSFWR